MKQAKARLGQSMAALANAQITPKQISVTQARARAGEAEAAKSKASLDQAELNLSYTKIIAPVDGVVGNRNAQVGQNVQVGQEMLSIVPLKDIWVTANFKETQLEHMRPGQPVEVKVDALGGKTFRARSPALAEPPEPSSVSCLLRTQPAITSRWCSAFPFVSILTTGARATSIRTVDYARVFPWIRT